MGRLDRKSRMSGDVHVRFREHPRGWFPRVTRRNIYVRSRRSGERVLVSISRFLEKRMRLRVNLAKSGVSRPEERHFLGFRLRVEPLDGRVEVLLSGRSVKRIREKIQELTPRNWGKSLEDCIKRINSYARGWMGFFRIVTVEEGRKLEAFDAHIRRRLRAIILRHWKRRRTMASNLIKLGVRAESAWRQVYGGKRSWWNLSRNPAVDRGLRNAYFAERGLESLRTMWEKTRLQAKTIVPKQLTLPGIALG